MSLLLIRLIGIAPMVLSFNSLNPRTFASLALTQPCFSSMTYHSGKASLWGNQDGLSEVMEL